MISTHLGLPIQGPVSRLLKLLLDHPTTTTTTTNDDDNNMIIIHIIRIIQY